MLIGCSNASGGGQLWRNSSVNTLLVLTAHSQTSRRVMWIWRGAGGGLKILLRCMRIQARGRLNGRWRNSSGRRCIPCILSLRDDHYYGCHCGILWYTLPSMLLLRGLSFTMLCRVLWVSSDEVPSDADAGKSGRTTLSEERLGKDKHDRTAYFSE